VRLADLKKKADAQKAIDLKKELEEKEASDKAKLEKAKPARKLLSNPFE
jgi:hypothetical protein